MHRKTCSSVVGAVIESHTRGRGEIHTRNPLPPFYRVLFTTHPPSPSPLSSSLLVIHPKRLFTVLLQAPLQDPVTYELVLHYPAAPAQ